MKISRQDLTVFAQNLKSALADAVKVLSSMVLVFLVLVIAGPLTYAVPHIERLF